MGRLCPSVVHLSIRHLCIEFVMACRATLRHCLILRRSRMMKLLGPRASGLSVPWCPVGSPAIVASEALATLCLAISMIRLASKLPARCVPMTRMTGLSVELASRCMVMLRVVSRLVRCRVGFVVFTVTIIGTLVVIVVW